jgi:hypothetical protein
MLDADGPGPPLGQDVIDGLDMSTQKFGARLTRCFDNHSGRSLFTFVTAPRVRQRLDQSCGFEPKVRVCLSVRRKVRRAFGHGTVPLRHGVDRKPSRDEDACSTLGGLAAWHCRSPSRLSEP